MWAEKIEALVDGFKGKGTVGMVIKDLKTGERLAINDQEVFPAASLIKLAIIWDLFQKVEREQLKLDAEIVLEAREKVGGCGILKELHAGLKVTLYDLAILMIVLSDNVATNILIDILGIKDINGSLKALQLSETKLQRKMMDFKAAQIGLDNYSSPREVAVILENFLISQRLSKSSGEQIVSILKRQQYNNKLPAKLPKEAVFAHKTGELPGIEHDAGIFFFGDRAVLLIVMIKDLIDNQDGIKLHIQIGESVYKHFCG